MVPPPLYQAARDNVAAELAALTPGMPGSGLGEDPKKIPAPPACVRNVD